MWRPHEICLINSAKETHTTHPTRCTRNKARNFFLGGLEERFFFFKTLKAKNGSLNEQVVKGRPKPRKKSAHGIPNAALSLFLSPLASYGRRLGSYSHVLKVYKYSYKFFSILLSIARNSPLFRLNKSIVN